MTPEEIARLGDLYRPLEAHPDRAARYRLAVAWMLAATTAGLAIAAVVYLASLL